MNTQRLAASNAPTIATLGDTPINISPDRSRIVRLVFISSLFFVLTTNCRPTKVELKDVNARFNLACRDSALLLPAVIADWLWRKTTIRQIFLDYKAGNVDADGVSEVLMPELHTRMKYADSRRMMRDIQSVFDGIDV